MNRRLNLTLAAAALSLAASAASAQPAPPPGPHGRHAPEDMQAMHAQMAKRHAEDLKIILRLRPDQESALAAFVASHAPKRVRVTMGGPAEAPLTTPERLDKMAKAEAAMAAARDSRRDALAKFYAALSPDQQKVFDALQRMHGPGGGPGMKRVEIRRGPGGPGAHGGPGMMHAKPHD